MKKTGKSQVMAVVTVETEELVKKDTKSQPKLSFKEKPTKK